MMVSKLILSLLGRMFANIQLLGVLVLFAIAIVMSLSFALIVCPCGMGEVRI
jgi:hypothetical protein